MRMLPPFPWTGHGGGIKKGTALCCNAVPKPPRPLPDRMGQEINVWMRPYLMSSMKAT